MELPHGTEERCARQTHIWLWGFRVRTPHTAPFDLPVRTTKLPGDGSYESIAAHAFERQVNEGAEGAVEDHGFLVTGVIELTEEQSKVLEDDWSRICRGE